MDRRSFAKLLALLPATSCIPKGSTMSQVGDLLAKLALGQQLTPDEIREIRIQGNQIQGMTAQFSALVSPSGSLDPNLFASSSSSFSVLPHECAGMAVQQEFSGQSIPQATVTQIKPFEDTASLPDFLKPMSYEFGIKRDLTNGEFYIEKVPGDGVFMFYGFASLTGATVTDSFVWLYEKVSNTGIYLAPQGGNTVGGCAIRKATLGEQRWQLFTYQESGGTRNLYEAHFAVARLR